MRRWFRARCEIEGGRIAACLQERPGAGDVPWAHVDIAGTAYENGKPYTPKGGAGFGACASLDPFGAPPPAGCAGSKV